MHLANGSEAKIRFGVFEADLNRQELRKRGVRLKLQSQPFRILAILLEHPGEIITREDLQRHLWGDGTIVDFDHSLGTAINKLREALGDSADSPRFIETIARRGFRFIAPVSSSAPMEAVPDSVPSEQVLTPAQEVDRTKKLLRIAAFTAGGLLLVMAGWLWRGMSPTSALMSMNRVTWSGRVFSGDINVESFPGLATDGTRVYFHQLQDGRFLLAQASLADGETHSLEMPPEVTGPSLTDLAPDGSKMLIRNHLDPEVEQPIWIVPTTGGAARRVSNVLAHDASWSPDGQSILYATGHDIFLVRADGNESPQKLASLPGRAFWMRWSPDGTSIRLTLLDPQVRSSALWELSADGRKMRPLLSGWRHLPAECCGNWTPDGKYFLFQSSQDGTTNIWALREQFFYRFLFPRPIQVTAGPLSYGAPAPSRRGDQVFVLGSQARSQLFRYDATTRQFVRCLPELDSAGRTEFSPSGTRVAWISTSDGSLWVSNPDGTQRIQLTSRPMQVYMMRWSSDAKQIAFMGKEPRRPWRIYLVPTEGGSAHPLFSETRNEADPSWSPDGNNIAFGRLPEYMAEDPSPKEIHIFDLRSGTLSVIPGSAGLFSPRYSPDGRSIAAISLNQRKLMVYDLASKKWSEIEVKSVDNPVWSDDSRFIYFHSFLQERQPINRVNIVTRKIESVFDFGTVSRINGVNYSFQGLSPDNSPLMSVHFWTADVYAMEWPVH